MKKIISALLLTGMLVALAPVYAEDSYGAGNANSTSTNQAINAKKPVTFDPICVQNAIDKRDNAIIAATDVYSAAAKTALQTRRDALKAAWALADRKARHSALTAAWKAYRSSLSKARKDFNKARAAAWKQWGIDRKACKDTPNDEFGTGAGVDATL